MTTSRSQLVRNRKLVPAFVAALVAIFAPACAMEEATEEDLELQALPAGLVGNTWALKTADGHYVTAVGGGGRTVGAIHTDATVIGPWETFTVENPRDPIYNLFAFRTVNGNYLTAEDGGNRTVNAIASNRTALGPWEKFGYQKATGTNRYQLRTHRDQHKYYVTARNGGNQLTNALETNRTSPGGWETFTFVRVN
jgi:hypothetical protein